MAEFTGTDLTCVRGERCVFAHLGFSMAAGEALVVIGPNGAGKSSLLRLMAGLLIPAGGSLCWNGEDVARDPEAHRQRVRYVGHADAVKPALSVQENLDAWAQLWGGPREAEVRSARALEIFGIARLAHVPGRYLSAGQRRRVALARLLVAPAALWLLDEPRTALDADAMRCLDAAIAAHRRGGGLVAVALHGAAHPPAARILDLAAAATMAATMAGDIAGAAGRAADGC